MLHRVLVVAGGLIVALSLCELLARVVLQPPLGDRVEITDQEGPNRADCYPRARGVEMPLDLARGKDVMALFRPLQSPKLVWPADATVNSMELPSSSTVY